MILSSLNSCPELSFLWSYSLVSISYKVLSSYILPSPNVYLFLVQILSELASFRKQLSDPPTSCFTTSLCGSWQNLIFRIVNFLVKLKFSISKWRFPRLTRARMMKETGALLMTEERVRTMPCWHYQDHPESLSGEILLLTFRPRQGMFLVGTRDNKILQILFSIRTWQIMPTHLNPSKPVDIDQRSEWVVRTGRERFFAWKQTFGPISSWEHRVVTNCTRSEGKGRNIEWQSHRIWIASPGILHWLSQGYTNIWSHCKTYPPHSSPYCNL